MKNRYSLLILKVNSFALSSLKSSMYTCCCLIKCEWLLRWADFKSNPKMYLEMKQHCRNTIFGQGIPQYLNGTMINQFAVKEYRVLTKDTNQMTQFNQCFDIKVQGI